MTLTLCGDHGVWQGQAAARFLSAVKMEMESKPEGAGAAADSKEKPLPAFAGSGLSAGRTRSS
jgi:pyruvate/2-oxoglutarate dehydrogenase complex dihydrolipoamide acyltransferase (E2) component